MAATAAPVIEHAEVGVETLLQRREADLDRVLRGVAQDDQRKMTRSSTVEVKIASTARAGSTAAGMMRV